MIAEKDWLKEYIGYYPEKTFPTTILHMYTMCNLNCEVCYVKSSGSCLKNGQFLSDKALEKVVKWSAEHNQCLYTGTGEPFLFWNEYTKPKLVSLIKKYNAKCIISTNGFWGKNENIINDIISLEVPCICFSIDYYHKVPIETINNAIEILSDKNVKTKIYMAQIVDDIHKIGHIKPINYDKLVKVEFPLNKNSSEDQGRSFHDANGNIVYTSNPPKNAKLSLNVFV